MVDVGFAVGWVTRPGRASLSWAWLAALACSALCASPALGKAPSVRALVNEYAGIEEAHLGVSLPGGPSHFITVTDSPKYSITEHLYGKTFIAGAVTTSRYNGAETESIGAMITVYGISHSRPEGDLRGVIAHEVFHVLEARLSGSDTVDDGHAGWLVEGAATWVESELVPNDGLARSEWGEYLRSPATPLFKRAYEAVGFFGHMISSGINPWSRFKAMFQTTSSAAAYTAAIGSSVPFLQNEASVFFREAGFGAEWDQRGRNVPSSGEVHYKPPTVHVTEKSHSPITAAPYSDTSDVLSITGLPRATPFLEVTVVKGHARIHSIGGGSVNSLEPNRLLLCSEPRYCECSQRPTRFERFTRGDLALTGGQTGGELELKLRKPCEELLPGASCETLLRGFGPLIRSVESKPLAVETHRSDGTTSSACAFLYKGMEIGPPEERMFVGAIAPVVSVTTASTYAGAMRLYQVLSVPIASFTVTRPGLAEEAVLFTRQTMSEQGQIEFGSSAVVRVHNVVASYSILSTPGNLEADRQESLRILGEVAAKL